MAQILSNVRVLDLTRVLAGPWCTQVLADMGAEVIKVESPNGGDESRQFPPFFAINAPGREGTGLQSPGLSCFFTACNRGKKSVVLDISTEGGQEAVRHLVQSCDVLVENFKVGNLARFGLDYASLSRINPRLIYCSITGFGQSGPLAANPGYDILFQGISGAMSTCGLPDSVPGGGPMRTLLPYTDLLTGMYATTGILAALLHRNATGEGQYIDLALLDVGMAATAYLGSGFLANGRSQERVGNSGVAAAPSGLYPCLDGSVIIQCNQRHWSLLCDAFDKSDWKADPRFASISSRLSHAKVLDEMIKEVTRARRKSEVVALVGGAGVPCAPVNTIGEAFAEPQVIHRELVAEVPLPDGGSVKVVRNPLRFSRTPTVEGAPPEYGAHSQEILRQ
jgi:crotonobetainyl-CoA:carnitine CoA-transferase CaiB-like acyl-CoA transferase